MKKLILLHNLNKFYKIFGAELGFPNFHIKLHDLKPPNLLEVLFDVTEVLEVYEEHDYKETQSMSRWLTNLKNQISTYCLV